MFYDIYMLPLFNQAYVYYNVKMHIKQENIFNLMKDLTVRACP